MNEIDGVLRRTAVVLHTDKIHIKYKYYHLMVIILINTISLQEIKFFNHVNRIEIPKLSIFQR